MGSGRDPCRTTHTTRHRYSPCAYRAHARTNNRVLGSTNRVMPVRGGSPSEGPDTRSYSQMTQ